MRFPACLNLSPRRSTRHESLSRRWIGHRRPAAGLPGREKPLPTFKKITLSDKFYCEGANCGDFNNDGKLDVVAGPYWYEGPDFQKKHEIYPPEAFDPHGYSNNFLTFTGDFNGDGWLDVLYVPHPGHRRLLVREPRHARAGRGRSTWPCTTAATSRRPGSISTATAARSWFTTPRSVGRAVGLCHLGPGQARTTCGSSIPSRPRTAATSATRTAWAWATSTATAAWTSSRPAAGGNSRPSSSRASRGSSIPSSSPRPARRCSSTTSTATAWPT